MERKFRGDFGVYCCPHVFRNERPILLVVRDPEGDWQFLCGESENFGDRPHLVEVGHLLERDNTLASTANLESGTGAKRTNAKSEWEYFDLD